jgi:dihydroorotate dehydrogenase subfamily 1
MIRITIDDKSCLLSHDKRCRNCVTVCPGHVLGIREEKIVVLRPEDCINCHCCKGACPGGLDVIAVERIAPLTVGDLPEQRPFWDGLKVQLGRLSLATPLIVASGPVGRCTEGWIRSASAGCGAVVTKTTTPLPWPGNPAIRLLPYEKDSLLNCEGLPNLGAEAVAAEITHAKGLRPGLLVIPSLTAMTEQEFVDMAKLFEDAGADGLEIALMGCPNYRPGTAISQGYWIEDPTRAHALVHAVRSAVNIPICVKGATTAAVGRACEEAGADSLLVRSGSLRALPLDAETGKPVLSHPRGEGSLTGPYTKLPGLKVVSDMVRQVTIPIIGNGGIASAQDVIDYIRVGATAVQLITVTIRRGLSIVPKLVADLETILKDRRCRSIEEIRSSALPFLPAP